MMLSTKQFQIALEEKDVKFTTDTMEESGKEVVGIRFSPEGVHPLEFKFIFDTDGEGVAIRVFNLVTGVASDKKPAMMQACNEVNRKYRFMKFVYDTGDDSVQMESDAVFRDNDVGEICVELMVRGLQIVKEAYPVFMKALWS